MFFQDKKIKFRYISDFQIFIQTGEGVPDFQDKAARDDVTFYRIKIDDQIRSKFIDNYTSRFGVLKPLETVDDKAVIKADLVQLDEENKPLENGIKIN